MSSNPPTGAWCWACLPIWCSFPSPISSLSAGTGALILFGAVQLTMFSVALRRGERFSTLGWTGLFLAAAGLVYLVSPGVAAPDPLGAILMAVAGVAWGAYSLLGARASDPLGATAKNFIFTVPLTLLVSLLFVDQLQFSPTGLALAVGSGALASGLGYVIWYAALAGSHRGSRRDGAVICARHRGPGRRAAAVGTHHPASGTGGHGHPGRGGGGPGPAHAGEPIESIRAPWRA